MLSDLSAKQVAEWRDARLKQVAPGTVNRELNLISHCFEIARREWKWISVSPTRDVQRPKEVSLVFDLKKTQLDSMFRKYRDRAGVENLTFHDTRHEAITRLASKLEVLELARMVGHRDIKMLMVYYNEIPEALADKLG